MNSYEELLCLADLLGFQVVEKMFKSSAKGLCKGNKIGISKTIRTSVEKRCILAEEMAHGLYTCGNILDISDPLALKQELYARAIAYEKLVSLPKLVKGYFNCSDNLYELPSYLNVTYEFFENALEHYSRKYGGLARHGEYVIYFSPLVICKSTRNNFLMEFASEAI